MHGGRNTQHFPNHTLRLPPLDLLFNLLGNSEVNDAALTAKTSHRHGAYPIIPYLFISILPQFFPYSVNLYRLTCNLNSLLLREQNN